MRYQKHTASPRDVPPNHKGSVGIASLTRERAGRFLRGLRNYVTNNVDVTQAVMRKWA